MVVEVTKKETLELLDLITQIATDPDSVDMQELEETWPNEKIAQYLRVIKKVVAESGALK